MCPLQENFSPVTWNSLLVIQNVPVTPTGSSEVQKLVRRFGTVIKSLVLKGTVRLPSLMPPASTNDPLPVTSCHILSPVLTATTCTSSQVICEMATAAMALSVHKRFQTFPCIIHNNPLFFSRKPDPKPSGLSRVGSEHQQPAEVGS